MKRLTSKRTWDKAKQDLVHELGYQYIWERLNEIENILGDDYDLERLKELLESAQAWNWSMNTLHGEIQALPAEDVAPVVHGKWKCLDGSQKHYCSVCGMDFDLYACVKKLFNYCPNCGARCDI